MENELAATPLVEEIPVEPSPVEPVIECIGTSRWHGEVLAVNNVSVQVLPGVTGLLGPNGAGKTTLIRMLVGLARPSAGSVRVLGADPWANTRLVSRIGYVPEGPPPWRDQTGRGCAIRAARYGGLSRSEAALAADRVLGRVGLTDDANRPVANYSHGMQQRLKFALALLNDPELLVLDEPLLGTDPLARRDLLQLIREAADAGASVLISTHVLPDVEALTSRILVLHRGRLRAYGEVAPIRDLLERYPRKVRIETPEPRRLGSLMWNWPSVESLDALSDSVVVHTRRPAEFYSALQAILATGDPPFTRITSPDEQVETVFRYLVEK